MGNYWKLGAGGCYSVAAVPAFKTKPEGFGASVVYVAGGEGVVSGQTKDSA